MTTKRDVAELAGVSPSTVTRVINDKGYVSAEVRTRVERAIQALHYVPNRIARSLKTQESHQIGCITHSITNPFYGEILLAIEERAYECGYTFTLYNANFEERDYERVIMEGLHDGLIVLSPVELNKVVQLEELVKTIPTVVYWDWGGASPIPCVTVDLRSGMQQAVNHLIEQGHQSIVFLGYECDTPEENPRFEGYLEAMESAGLPIQEAYLQLIPKWQDTLASGYQKIKEFLKLGVPVTAIAASNDLLATGAIRALHECGKRVPFDVSVTGFDDIELAQMLTPSLTTVRVPKQAVGHTLVALLMEQLQSGNQLKSNLELPTEMVVRESVRDIKITRV